ncbi:MAG: hypothetical protein KME45_32445 [Stenomitos rutilans HA7619-LM2]|jgi:hypothetical protein|nr:hypothetical protein [Stenomitos rutilans HA7619-LM2]
MPESIQPDQPNFAVVQVDEPLPWSEPEMFYAMLPREEPHTYATLQSAAALVASLMEDFGHTPESTRIYRLVPLADQDALPLIQQALSTLRQEEEQ